MIDISQQGEITLLHMAHGKANALDVEFCEALTTQLIALQSSRTRAVVLSGAGHIFSAGVDLLRLLDEDATYLQTFLPALITMFATVFFHPQPVVAAVNGHAIAGGCILACAADHRVMSRYPGRIGVPELLVGVPFPTVALEILRSVVAPPQFHTLVYGGATYTPEEASHLGLVDALVEPQELIACAVAAAERLLMIPAPAFALTKQQLRQPVVARLQAAHAGTDQAVQHLWMRPETHEAIRRYVSQTFKKSKEALKDNINVSPEFDHRRSSESAK
jgi:enoyl-CoA hydratase